MHLEGQLFTIQQLSFELKVPKPTLRFWEKEMGDILIPFRTHGGQRRYTREHVAIVKKIRDLRQQGTSLAEIKKALKGINQKPYNNMDWEKIDFLANRIAQVVREEVYSLFRREDLRHISFNKKP